MRAKGPLRAGIVGCGKVAQEHLRIWSKLDRVSVAAVCDANESRAERTAQAWHIPAYYKELSPMHIILKR